MLGVRTTHQRLRDPWLRRRNSPYCSTHSRHDHVNETHMNFWVGLNIRCQDLCMLPKVNLKGISAPAPMGFDRFEGHSSQQVFQGATYPEGVTR